MQADREKSSKRSKEPRASTTDPDARVMHMADNGFRPAANLQVATDTQTRLVVGVEVSHRGSDSGGLAPMLEAVEANTGLVPEELLADRGYVAHADIQAVEEKGVAVIAPPTHEPGSQDPTAPRKGDTLEIAGWRLRMSR